MRKGAEVAPPKQIGGIAIAGLQFNELPVKLQDSCQTAKSCDLNRKDGDGVWRPCKIY
jgi:hypothetical protein